MHHVTVGKEPIIRRLYGRGSSVTSIAKKLGVATTAVSLRLEKMGLRERINQKHVSADNRTKIADLYRKKVPTSKIAKMFKITNGTVLVIARKQGCRIHPKGQRYRNFTKREVNRIASLWNRGESQWNIARRFLSSQPTIGRVLRSAGIRKETRRACGERHGMWKGGAVTQGGYRLVRIDPGQAFFSMGLRMGYVLEHRLRMAEKLGRPLTSKESVHHINGNRSDNRIENLELRHIGNHPNGQRHKCADCGSTNIVAY